MKRFISFFSVVSALFLFSSFAQAKPITTQEVFAAQDEWAKGIENISRAFIDKKDYKAVAEQHVRSLYGYGMGKVLFKPTLADQDKFRETFEEALSYFITGIVAEDKGFAIKPWSKVRYGYRDVITDDNSAVSMGKYYFTPAGSTEEIGVEFTFGYFRDDSGKLRINLHHSSLPYSSE